MRELTCLGYWINNAGMLANTQWRPAASAGVISTELDTKEMAEIKFVEVRSPILPDGTPEDLASIYLVLDEEPTQTSINLTGRNDMSMAPPRQHMINGMIIPLGDGIIDAMKGPRPLLDNTTLKFRSSARIVCTAGNAAITQPFSVRLWGYKYTERDLLKMLGGNTTMPGQLTINEALRDRTFTVQRPTISINWENWDQLPGGVKQPKPSVMPFMRWAVNAQATTLNTPYMFRFERGQVAQEEQDLYWNFDQKEKALLIKGIGIRHAANLTYAAIVNTAEAKAHPKGRYLLAANNNPLHFGQATPIINEPYRYFAIPRFAEADHLIWKDLAYLAIWDNGQVPVAANSVQVAVNGVVFDLKA
jgi:hypothetical protein